MKTDNRGCSTCAPGAEQYETFSTRVSGGKYKRMVQYEYRTPAGRLFTCIATDLQTCRQRRDNWMRANRVNHNIETDALGNCYSDADPGL